MFYYHEVQINWICYSPTLQGPVGILWFCDKPFIKLASRLLNLKICLRTKPIKLNHNAYTHFSIAIYFKLSEMRPILTVGKIILSHPLSGVLSSLSSELHHSHSVDKINLKPLVTRVMTRGPGPHAWSSTPPVNSAIWRTMIYVPARGGW